MKSLMAGVTVLIAAVFLWVSTAELAGIEPVGKVSIFGGAEKEEGAPGGGRAVFQVLGVIPFNQQFGLQGLAHYVGGRGSRFGLSTGPLFAWGSGKAGLFVAYEHRTFNSNNFVHLRPSVAFYLPQANVNLWYSHPISSPQRDNDRVEYGINRLQGTFSYFPGADLASFLRRDNVELTLGLQANSFGGVGSGNLNSGVGPVFGMAFMPAQNIEVSLLRGSVDHHGRYKVMTGFTYYFNKGAATLKELRRRYLEPNTDGSTGGAGSIRKVTTGYGNSFALN